MSPRENHLTSLCFNFSSVKGEESWHSLHGVKVRIKWYKAWLRVTTYKYFHYKFMFISFPGMHSNPASLCLCFQSSFDTVPLSWVSICFISFWLIKKSKHHRNLCINVRIFTVTKGTQIAKDNISRLHHVASKRPSDTVRKHSFERWCQSIRHITNEIIITSPRSDMI